YVSLLKLQQHTYTLFPYTTLFRSLLRKWADEGKDLIAYLPYMRTMLGHESFEETAYYLKLTAERFPYIKERMKESFRRKFQIIRSEEHTSELQSRFDIVCRLLLEK